MNDDVIKKCFEVHKKDIPEIKFTYNEYREFWLNHKPGNQYQMTDRDGSTNTVRVAYYPLPYYRELRACVEFEAEKRINGLLVRFNDFRDVPIHFLNLII